MSADHKDRVYRFHFLKDRFWIWAVVLPFGLITWSLPFIILWGLRRAGETPDWFPWLMFFVLGIPSYMIGWIFVYSLMEGFYTRVKVNSNFIIRRMPWLIFPLIPVEKKIGIHSIERMDLFGRYGTRRAVYLYYLKNSRQKKFYLPWFQHDPRYWNELQDIQAQAGCSDPAAAG